jgi:hypothetical protein
MKKMDMMIDRLIERCKQAVAEHPDLRDDIRGIFDLCMMEIEDDCASVDHEVELAFADLDELINDKLTSARG